MQKLKLSVELLESRCTPTVLTVGPGEQFQTIQSAVNAANPGDTVLIDPGVYTEQVLISGIFKSNITLTAVVSQSAVVRAPQTMTGNDALIEVGIATGVTIDGLTLTGKHASGQVGGVKDGVLVRDHGSVTVQNSHITQIIFDSTFNVGGSIASTNGYAVQVGDNTTPGTVTVQNSTLDNYQKGGVWVQGSNSSATVAFDTITGVGPTGALAQFGVKVQSGASATINNDQISGDRYTGSNGFGRGINVTGGGTISVDTNSISSCDIGVSISSTAGALVTNNTISSNTSDGINLTSLIGTTTVRGNTVNNNGHDGIALINSTGVTVQSNTADNNGHDGIFVDANSALNTIQFNTARGNTNLDAEDLSTGGSGTNGTRNTWGGDSFGNSSGNGSPLP